MTEHDPTPAHRCVAFWSLSQGKRGETIDAASVSCSCGWKTSSDYFDNDEAINAFTDHVLTASRSETQQSIAWIAAEREAQITREGYTTDHDDEHDNGQLAFAGSHYARQAYFGKAASARGTGDWPKGWEFKPASPIRMLVKAGALIVAEIDRRLRKDEAQRSTPSTDPAND